MGGGVSKDLDNKYIIAADAGKLDEVCMLLQKGADAQAINENRRSAIMLAAMKGHVDVVREIISALEKRKGFGVRDLPALFEAALGGHTSTMLLLLEHLPAGNIQAKDTTRCGCTCLHLAASKGRNETVDVLIQMAGTLVRVKNGKPKINSLASFVRLKAI